MRSYRKNDANAFTKEVWLFAPDNGAQYLCSACDAAPIGGLVESLYNAITEDSKHPKIKPEFQYAIDAFMQDDISDFDLPL